MDLELHQLDLRHQRLRTRNAARERRVLASIADIGQQTPIVVVRDCDSFIVIDGFKRERGVRRLKRDLISATIWEMSEADALMSERLIRAGDADNGLEHGLFLKELCERFGLTREEVARRFDRTPSWVSRRIALATDLPPSVREHVRDGAIGAHAAMKYLVPLARANRDDCVRLADAIAPERMSNRQIGELYALYLRSGAKARELLLSAPTVALRACDEAARSKDKSPVELLVDDLGIVAAVARRAHGRLIKGAFAEADAPAREGIRAAHERARGDFESLMRRCEKEMRDAGRDDPSDHPATT